MLKSGLSSRKESAGTTLGLYGMFLRTTQRDRKEGCPKKEGRLNLCNDLHKTHIDAVEKANAGGLFLNAFYWGFG